MKLRNQTSGRRKGRRILRKGGVDDRNNGKLYDKEYPTPYASPCWDGGSGAANHPSPSDPAWELVGESFVEDTQTVPYPAGYQAGDLAVFLNYAKNSTNTAPSGAGSLPSGYTSIRNYSAAGQGVGGRMAYKILTGNESSSLSGGKTGTQWYGNYLGVFRHRDGAINTAYVYSDAHMNDGEVLDTDKADQRFGDKLAIMASWRGIGVLTATELEDQEQPRTESPSGYGAVSYTVRPQVDNSVGVDTEIVETGNAFYNNGLYFSVDRDITREFEFDAVSQYTTYPWTGASTVSDPLLGMTPAGSFDSGNPTWFGNDVSAVASFTTIGYVQVWISDVESLSFDGSPPVSKLEIMDDLGTVVWSITSPTAGMNNRTSPEQWYWYEDNVPSPGPLVAGQTYTLRITS